ncbi:telomere binding protein [Coemansia nantahalensis]|uniref:Telomere binding protein n=1 Tax=Coemansia nantahalensis TaxID=2789366 RepID=A0ACC1K3G5_9FUNG|nr:telomere binding protein [Coemansia nantahalensis]
MEARQRLRNLGKHVEQLARQLRPDPPAAAVRSTGDSGQSLGAGSTSEGEARAAVETLLGGEPSLGPRAALVLPGSTAVAGRRGLITLVDPDDGVAPAAAHDEPTGDSRGELLDRLVAAVAAPLVGVGAAAPPELVQEAGRPDGAWAQWWIDTGAAAADKAGIVRHVGAWFARTVVGEVAPLVAAQGPGSRLEQAVLGYSGGRTPATGAVCWQALAAAAGVLAGRDAATSALRLVVMLLERAATRAGGLAPQRVLELVGPADGQLARGEWGDYLQIACTLPERIANRVDPQSVPAGLRPREYFAWLARAAVDCAAAASVAELWSKLCRVGQTDALCVELAAALVEEARRSDSGQLAALARRAADLPAPFRARAAAGVVRQLDIVGAADDTANRAPFGTVAAQVVAALVSAQLAADGDSTGARCEAVSALVAPQWTWMGTYQAVVLALQQLAGAYPGLLYDAVEQVVVPQWSAPELVGHAQPTATRRLTALAMMCVGALTPEECRRLSMSAAFAQAIPRFLDAPTALVRLAGVVVADAVVSRAPQPGKGEDGDEAGSIDFGLDDMLCEAQTAGATAHARASASYITEMRGYAAPIAEQWAPQAAGSGAVVLAGAADYMRTYSGADTAADEHAVLAPRATSLTAEAGLAGAHVKPRKPAFLRDCLAYLRGSGKEGDDGAGIERAQIALFALAECVERAGPKAVEEQWTQIANRVLHLCNRGPESMDAAWDAARKRALVALAVRLPLRLGPFLADRSCDRNLTAADRQLVLSAIATACLQLAGVDGDMDGVPGPAAEATAPSADQSSDIAGTVVRRSRRLDIQKAGRSSLAPAQRQYASLVGPAFYSPLVAQYGRSDMSTESLDVRRDGGQLARYLNTVAVILHTAGAAPHLLAMNREFWELAKLVRRIPAPHIGESPPVVDALLFGIDVLLDPARALSTPTLAREFSADISDVLRWISSLAERDRLDASAQTHAARIVARLQEIQGDVYRRVAAGDLHQFTSII